MFPVDGREKTWGLTEEQVAEWATDFPSLVVIAECRSALAWVKARPDRRKTTRGMKPFLVSWMNRSQNNGRGRGNGERPTLEDRNLAVANAMLAKEGSR